MRLLAALLLMGTLLSGQVAVGYTACRTFMVSSGDCAVQPPEHCQEDSASATASSVDCPEICQVVAEKQPALFMLPEPASGFLAEGIQPAILPQWVKPATEHPIETASSLSSTTFPRLPGEVYLLNSVFLI